MGRVVERSVAARVARRELAVGDHRWMPRVGAGTGDGLSTSAAPALLGAQDAEHFGEGAAARRKTGQGAGAEDLLGRACRRGAAGFRAVPLPLAVPLPGDGPPTGARSAGTAALLRISTTPVAEAAHHQCDRALFRRSPATDTTHGGVHQRGKRGSDYLCDFQSLQRGLEKPHPPTIYTSSLTSPRAALRLAKCSTRVRLIGYLDRSSRWIRRCRSAGMLARSASEFVERYLRNAAHVDSNGWQGAAESDAGGEPLVECPVVRNGSRADDISDHIRRKSIRTLV